MSGTQTPAPTPAPSPAPSSAPAADRPPNRALSVEGAVAALRRAREASGAPPGTLPPSRDHDAPGGLPGAPGAVPGLPPGAEPFDPLAGDLAQLPPPSNDNQAPDPLEQLEASNDNQAAEPEGEVELVVDGQVMRVPVARALELARQGLDYTRKTQALAEQRRQVEARAAELQQLMPMVQQHLAQLTQQAQAKVKQLSPEEFAKLRAEDPWAAMQHVMDVQQAQQLQQVEAQARQAWEQQQQRILETQLQQEEQRLAAVIPAWANPQQRTAIKAALHQAGTELGFSPEELGQVYDHRMVRTLFLAAKQLRAERAMPRAQAAAPAAPPAPGAPRQVAWPTGTGKNMGRALGEVRRTQEALQQTGKIDDAVAALVARRQLQRGRR